MARPVVVVVCSDRNALTAIDQALGQAKVFRGCYAKTDEAVDVLFDQDFLEIGILFIGFDGGTEDALLDAIRIDPRRIIRLSDSDRSHEERKGLRCIKPDGNEILNVIQEFYS